MAEIIKDKLIFDIQDRWKENLTRIEKCLAMLNEEQAWTSPGPRMNSVGNLILHLNGNIGQYILSALGHGSDNRKREKEFMASSRMPMKELMDGQLTTLQKASALLNDLTDKDLIKDYKVQGFEMNGVSILVHVTEHYSYHTGQIALLTKLMTGNDLGFYAGFDLNVTNDDRATD